MNFPNSEEIRENLDKLRSDYEVVLYGSIVTGDLRPNSDIDVAVITRIQNMEENEKIQYDLFGIAPLKYDIRVFELFPIYIKIEIIRNYQVLFGNPLEISEYFYGFRKKWEDCKHRILYNQFKSYKEILK